MVVISAVAIVASKGPITTGAADNGDNDNNDDNGQNDNGDNSQGDSTVAPAVTTLSVAKTAYGFWERTVQYNWDVEKDVYSVDGGSPVYLGDGHDMVIEQGESAIVYYTIDVERSACVTDVFGVRGVITVTNTGDNATENLVIWDTVQTNTCDCGWEDLVTVKVDTSCHPVLAAGESYAYGYEVYFDPICDVEYRNVANATITNFADDTAGVQDSTLFCLPGEPGVVAVLDENAVLDDFFSVPNGFTFEALTFAGQWYLEGCEQTSWEFCVGYRVTNVCVGHNVCYVLENQAILDTVDTEARVVGTADLNLYTGPYEATLAIDKNAWVHWTTEDVVLNADIASGVVDVSVLDGNDQALQNDVDPEELPMVVYVSLSDVCTFVVNGEITVTNTGIDPTECLTITDTVQMSVLGGEWTDIASVCVDTSAKPVLCPGESYCYPYTVTFSVNLTDVGPLADLQFQNVAFAHISNWDDDSEDCAIGGVYVCVPLNMPCKPDVVNIQAHGSYVYDTEVPLDRFRCVEASVDIEYNMEATIWYYDDCVSIQMVTKVTCDGSAVYDDGCTQTVIGVHCEINDQTCKTLNADTGTVIAHFNAEDTKYDEQTLSFGCDDQACFSITGDIIATGDIVATNANDAYGFAVAMGFEGSIDAELEPIFS
jgi:hypothetical protein